MKKHEILENIRIEKLIFGGSGLATAPDGCRIIVSGSAIPESVVNLRITKIRKNHLEAQILSTVKKSPLEAPIPEGWQLYGGCKWLPIPYAKQLEIKEQQIREAFHNLSDFTENTKFHPIVASPEDIAYRNKLEFSWGKYISDREAVHDEYRFGFHAPGQFDRIIDCTYCVLADEEVNAIFHEIDAWARASSYPTYDPKMNTGFWRHLVVRKAKKTAEIMLIFSLNSTYTSGMKDFFQDFIVSLGERFSHIKSIFFLENTGRADIVQGNPILIFGKGSITEELLGYTFEIQPKSFFQVNTLGAQKLYTLAIDSIKNKGGILLDLYAGTGTIGILLSPYFEKVYSVELVASASEDGKRNAKRNGVSNVEFVNAKVEDFAQEFSQGGKNADTIVLDPPRDGLHPSAIPHILLFGATEIIYVSCNPATLVRDIGLILEHKKENTTPPKYRITDVTPVDMFPHTHHIETVVRLERL